MENRVQGTTWKEIYAGLVKDFTAWGCRYSRKKLPEIAMGYECTPLFFWNWMDDPEVNRSETGFLRVLGYAWRKHLREEGECFPLSAAEDGTPAVKAGRKAA